jgi:hypothetical protein
MITSTREMEQNKMKNLISQLNKIANSSNERARRNIKNLVGRIEWFEECGDEEKLSECVAEASLWGAK